MRNRRLIDTNLIVRYLVQDEEKQARAAGRLFDACDRGELTIVVLPAVLAESVFVLESFYERPRADIASALGRLISSPGIEIREATIHVDALNRYRKSSATLGIASSLPPLWLKTRQWPPSIKISENSVTLR